MFGVCKIVLLFVKEVNPPLPFNQIYSQIIMKQYCYLIQLFFIVIYSKIKCIPAIQNYIFSIITPVFSVA